MKYFIILSLIVFFIGCSKSSSEPEKTAQEYLNEGWNYFEQNNYSSALSSFKNAILKNTILADAHNGAGWSAGKTGDTQSSLTYFQDGYNLESGNNEIKAGLSFSLNANQQFSESNNHANTINQSWIFEHDTTLSFNDIILLKAQNYFALGDFPSSINQVKILNPTFDCDTNTIEGIMALADEIERLKLIT